MEQKTQDIVAEVKRVMEKITVGTKTANAELFLACYDNSPGFLAVGGDGIIRDYCGFEQICKDYYNAVEHQEVDTVKEEYRTLGNDFVIVAWTGNMTANFKNGDEMIMKNYSVSFLFRNIDGEWKVIHSHESSLPPEIIKASK